MREGKNGKMAENFTKIKIWFDLTLLVFVCVCVCVCVKFTIDLLLLVSEDSQPFPYGKSHGSSGRSETTHTQHNEKARSQHFDLHPVPTHC